MIENTLENKAYFFSQYIGSNCTIETSNSMGVLNEYTFHLNIENGFEKRYILLKSMENISDDDHNMLMCKRFPFQPKYKRGKFYFDHLNINQADYLRSKGYALPFNDTTVETLIKYGWVKLINSEIDCLTMELSKKEKDYQDFNKPTDMRDIMCCNEYINK